MTRREHYLWARRNYPDRTAVACWKLSLQLLELERSCPGGELDEARARQFVAAQTVAIGMAQASLEAISSVASAFATAVNQATQSLRDLAYSLNERGGTASGSGQDAKVKLSSGRTLG